MKKKNWWQWLLLIAVLSVLGYSLWAVDAVGNHLQYIVEPTGDMAEAAADLVSLAEEWETTQCTWTLGGFIQEAVMKAEDQSARGRITLYGENGLSLQPQTLLYGRLFTENELISGESVALLDEQLALALFREVDVVDRTFTLGGLTFQVIGVVRHTKQVGDYTDYGVYIPLMSGLQPDALVVEADPLPDVGAGVSFFGVCQAWRSGGAFIDLHKEAFAATMWARVLAFVIGASVLVKAVGFLYGRANTCIGSFQRKLQRSYAVQLFPQMVGMVLIFILGYAAVAGLAAFLLDFIIQPVYVFPEWVPSVLVEWKEIQSTFWQVQQSSAGFRELRTPALIRIRYFNMLINICTVLTIALMALVIKHIKRKDE